MAQTAAGAACEAVHRLRGEQNGQSNHGTYRLGRVLSGNGDVEQAIGDALQSTRGRYTMAYTAPVSDGKRHKLRVACTREGIRLITPQERFAISSGDHSNRKP